MSFFIFCFLLFLVCTSHFATHRNQLQINTRDGDSSNTQGINQETLTRLKINICKSKGVIKPTISRCTRLLSRCIIVRGNRRATFIKYLDVIIPVGCALYREVLNIYCYRSVVTNKVEARNSLNNRIFSGDLTRECQNSRVSRIDENALSRGKRDVCKRKSVVKPTISCCTRLLGRCIIVSSNGCAAFIEHLDVIIPVCSTGNLDVLNVDRATVDRLEGRDHEVEPRDRILGLISDCVWS